MASPSFIAAPQLERALALRLNVAMSLVLKIAAGVLLGLLAFVAVIAVMRSKPSNTDEAMIRALTNAGFLVSVDCGQTGVGEVTVGSAFRAASREVAAGHLQSVWSFCGEKRSDVTSLSLYEGAQHIGYFDPVKGLTVFGG